MKKPVKITLIALLAVFCLMILLSSVSGIFIQKAVLPQAAEILGTQVNIASSGINLLAGRFSANDITIDNPDGFDEPHFLTAERISVRISLIRLMTGRIVLSSVRVRDLNLNIIRNRKAELNTQYFAERLQVKSDSSTPRTSDSGSAAVPMFRLASMRADMRLRYIDHAFTTNTVDLAFKTSVKAKNIANFGAPDKAGSFSVNGHLESDPRVLASSITGTVYTLIDPAKPSFEINGIIKSVHTEALDEIARQIGLYSKEFTVETPLKCENGKLRGNLTVTFREPMAVGKLARKIKNTTLPPVVTVTVPVRGTAEKPQVDWLGAILQSLIDNAIGNLDAVIRKTDISPDAIEKQIDNVVDSFKGLLKKKK